MTALRQGSIPGERYIGADIFTYGISAYADKVGALLDRVLGDDFSASTGTIYFLHPRIIQSDALGHFLIGGDGDGLLLFNVILYQRS